ncbi:minor tail protein [Microbacterium phage Pumpernickel]|uniref:Minor tail protein n=1 Tax=Microbacterium phage Pumpernickel TaxID=2885983 RepID=A0AAE9C2G3_9CAUD|nr:minor tail protein [Microbacterium phage Pumpernickel]UDL15888.1 minor tail protein [Microbacterium phage Pumpernickel]
MPEQPPAIAPVYRYFTADLLTNTILAEIPFRGVSWERALKGAGKFDGKIPITAETDSMNLYNTTMPGQTALYVVRNGVCVWGGIIWSRQYEFSSKDLQVSASEFQSYFHHRKIWKTWNHQYGGTVSYNAQKSSWEVARMNLATNPRATSVAGRSISVGGNTGTISATSTAGMNVGGLGIDSFVRAESAGTGTYIDLRSTYSGIEIETADTFSVSNWARPSTVSGATGVIYVQQYNSADTLLTTTQSSPVELVSGWNNLTFSTSLLPSTTRVTVITRALGSVIAGSRLDLTAELWETTASAGTYFDGSFTNTSSKQYTWDSTANASVSNLSELTVIPANWNVRFDNGSAASVRPGSSVKLEFYEPSNFTLNGQYRVANSPAPTKDEFWLTGGRDVADITTIKVIKGIYYFYTREAHGFKTGDSVTAVIESVDGSVSASPMSIPFTATVPAGDNSNVLTWNSGIPTLNRPTATAEGVIYRPIPVGTYTGVTITIRQDTYDYIRTLIDSMFEDFVGIDFPNVYIEPGVSYGFDVVGKEAQGGYAILQTSSPHGVAPGQAIQVKDVGGAFDGEFEVTDTPSATSIVYQRGGAVPPMAVSPLKATVTAVRMNSGRATLTTSAPHGFSLGQNVTVKVGDPYSTFDGTWTVIAIPTPTTFEYLTASPLSYSLTTLPYATTSVAGDPINEIVRAEVSSNVVTLELKDPVIYSPGDSVTVSGAYRELQIKEKALDAQNSVADIQTTEPHGFSVGDTVTISGLQDTATTVTRTSTASSVTLTTTRPHNFRAGDSVSIYGSDSFRVTNKALINKVATLTTSVPHSLPVGTSITVSGLTDSVGISNRRIVNGVAILTTSMTHNFKVNDTITVSGLTDTYPVSAKEANKGTVILTTSRPHNLLVGQKITVNGVGAPFDGTTIEIQDVTATRIIYQIDQSYWDAQKAAAARKGKKLSVPLTVPQTKASGTITAVDSFYNGEFVVSARTSNTISYSRGGQDQPSVLATGTGYRVSGSSPLNGTFPITARTATTVSYAVTGANIPSAAVPAPSSDEVPPAKIEADSILTGTKTLTATTSTSVTFSQSLLSTGSVPSSLSVRKASIFNGTRTITAIPGPDRFRFTLTGYSASILEESASNLSFVRGTSLYNGTFTISAVNTADKTIKYAKTLNTYGSKAVQSRGTASVNPTLVVSSFGPYPGNADIGIGYSSQGYTGINVEPTPYRGFELKTVGEALDAYSDTINGFEYRVDCDYNEAENRFTKTFVLIPIDFPNPPPPGQVSPISRFGADKLVFEYPGGSITDVSIEESAEESATRFFAVGETDLGPEAGPEIGIASAEDLLQGRDGRAWPLLDAAETVDGVDDENILFGYAQRYLSEFAPPYTSLSVSVNGSIPPFVDSYKPGDWCSLILNDPFARMRLISPLEPRQDVIVRKIDSFKVNVPDGVTFPETVQLTLVAEWEVDKRV